MEDSKSAIACFVCPRVQAAYRLILVILTKIGESKSEDVCRWDDERFGRGPDVLVDVLVDRLLGGRWRERHCVTVACAQRQVSICVAKCAWTVAGQVGQEMQGTCPLCEGRGDAEADKV